MLRFELQKPARYHGILEAVGNGKRELDEIRAYLTLDRVGDITRYLGYLRDDLGLLVPDEPVPAAKRTSRYRLEDPFFDFYYRCISRNLSILELGGEGIVARKIRQELPSLTARAAEAVLHQLLTWPFQGRAFQGNAAIRLPQMRFSWRARASCKRHSLAQSIRSVRIR